MASISAVLSTLFQQKNPDGTAIGIKGVNGVVQTSGPESSGLDEAHLVPTGREFPTLIALHDHTTT